MTRFSTLTMGPDGKAVETNVREISQADLRRCPHFIMAAEHYREDGTCRCNDPEATDMAEWGYEWRDGQWQAPEEED
jgi:hypothetical protein